MKLAYLLLSLHCLGASLFGYEVKVRVVDDWGAPIREAEVVVYFAGIVDGQDVEHRGKTGEDGAYTASGKSLIQVLVLAKKEGYYPARVERLSPHKDHDLTVVLPRVLKPLPLYALTPSMEKYSRGIVIPMQNEWLGFDLEVGDWVTPHGKGKVTDVRFRFRNEFKGWKDHVKLPEEIEYAKRAAAKRRQEWSEEQFLERFRITAGKWDAELEISFPGEKEGLVEVTDKFVPYSQMKMPHLALADGYLPAWRLTTKTYGQLPPKENMGFFLRTRVKLDEQGNIVSAHYSKVMGDFQLAAAGRITFTYYFNPTPNDRNLEFDPKRNLFPKDKPGANVFLP